MPVQQTFTLDRAGAAQALSEDGAVTGRLMLTLDGLGGVTDGVGA